MTTGDSRSPEDVYELVETRLDNLETSSSQFRESQERMEVTIDVLADKMIGPKIPDPLRPGEFVINGRGEFMRKARPKWPKWIGQALIQSLGVATALLLFLAATA